MHLRCRQRRALKGGIACVAQRPREAAPPRHHRRQRCRKGSVGDGSIRLCGAKRRPNATACWPTPRPPRSAPAPSASPGRTESASRTRGRRVRLSATGCAPSPLRAMTGDRGSLGTRVMTSARDPLRYDEGAERTPTPRGVGSERCEVHGDGSNVASARAPPAHRTAPPPQGGSRISGSGGGGRATGGAVGRVGSSLWRHAKCSFFSATARCRMAPGNTHFNFTMRPQLSGTVLSTRAATPRFAQSGNLFCFIPFLAGIIRNEIFLTREV